LQLKQTQNNKKKNHDIIISHIIKKFQS